MNNNFTKHKYTFSARESLLSFLHFINTYLYKFISVRFINSLRAMEGRCRYNKTVKHSVLFLFSNIFLFSISVLHRLHIH